MPLPDVLRKLLTAPGPSGYEQAAAAVFRDAAAAFAEVTYDSVGSTVARVKGTAGGPLLAVIGHIDEIGLIVHHIDDDGFLWFTGVGGWDPVILVGQRVRDRHARRRGPRRGRQEADPPAQGGGAQAGAGAARDARRHRRERRRGRPRAGPDRRRRRDRAASRSSFPNGRVVSRSMDNRLGCFVAFEVARLVAEAGGAPGDVAGVAVAQEEITFAGARTTAYSLQPDLAIVVDVNHATDAPGIDEKELGKHEFGSGPVIARGSTLDPKIFELLYAAGEESGVPFTVEASARYTGTDADAVHISRGGVPTGVVSIPLRYMHSPVEMVQLDDVENAAKLIAAFAQKLSAELDFKR